MKTLYITILSLILTCGLNAQIVFESNLDSWMGLTPTDWFGSKSSLEEDSTEQITDGVTYGTALARLTNLENSHRRFTTQPLALEEGVSYEVEVWCKGTGQVRTNLWDGSGGNGYNTYGQYEDVSAELTSIVQTIFSDTTSAEQEVIISFRGGVLDVDRVEVRIAAVVDPTASTIYDIQFTEDASGDSPLVGTPVITSGVVTAVAPSGYYIQSGTGSFTGLFIDDSGNAPAIGDEVSVTGTVEEFFDFTRLINVTDYAVVSSGNTVAPTAITTLQGNEEEYESMLVMTTGENTVEVNNFGEWAIDDMSGELLVDDQMFEFIPVLGESYHVTGALNYSFGAFKLEPRDQEDVMLITSIVEEANILFAVYPNPATDVLRLTLADSENATIEMIDLAGRTVKTVSLSGTSTSIEVSDLERGHYILRMTTQDGFGLKQVTLN